MKLNSRMCDKDDCTSINDSVRIVGNQSRELLCSYEEEVRYLQVKVAT